MSDNKDYYIFPSNYNQPEKFLGIVEYKLLVLIFVWLVIIIGLLSLMHLSGDFKIYLFIFLFCPPAVLLLIGVNGDSIFKFISYFIKYIVNSKIYYYNKGN